ncbi:unnamed protein product, partial [Cuscuta epithymum]
MRHPAMASERIRMVISQELERRKEMQLASKEEETDQERRRTSAAKSLWLNKKGCPLGSVPIRRMSKHRKLEPKVQPHFINMDDRVYASTTDSHLDFAGLIVRNAPSGRFSGGKATMTIWNPQLKGDHQYSSVSMYVEDGDNQIRVGWIVYPALYGDSRTRLFSRWTSDGYAKTGCYINHCPGFVIFSNIIPLDYPYPNMSEFEGTQYDTTLIVFKGSAGDWVLNFNEEENLGMWTKSIFSTMSESAAQLRFGGECFKPQGQEYSPQMGSGRFKNGQYDKTCYMRRLFYFDPVYGNNVIDDSMVQPQDSRCYYEGNYGYNYKDNFYAYNFFLGGGGGRD